MLPSIGWHLSAVKRSTSSCRSRRHSSRSRQGGCLRPGTRDLGQADQDAVLESVDQGRAVLRQLASNTIVGRAPGRHGRRVPPAPPDPPPPPPAPLLHPPRTPPP